ncbi:TetR/AcrR family transcriptional regulator C-terminal domain-containing protein [Mycolicibacterium litorale]|uniref:TetR family transcriptional regulator n=1 Tax=Mycolicibacterium litorale TaxID=758802 RepID=A0AAD1INN1_9MYCO|nr:TetR/AcrR family transcriptional regulator C-terminal domain-containing protein [Mycolicibacterium litorale]MCV7417842.1 TetR/AcrR family transcriptional regulator C-terminal domain-containing protein [Mycolicibacterium litorale]TDY06769.1 TetR family transcriptional regulator [Mycolicibacterium litorale]BBY19075.1 TetR family transcriptional regulator [Mycolicibacterium litorale]
MGDERRARGRPARINREQIVAAARRAAGPQLTMQAVADELGVSRKALHYYVGNRQGLLTLVVLDRFDHELQRVRLPDDGDWRAVLRAYAFAFRDGIVQVGEGVDQMPFSGVGAVAVLALAERVLAAMLSAGFAPDDARRGVTAVANIAQSAAHDTLRSSVRDFHQAQTRAALERSADTDYPALRRVLAAAPSPDDGQFAFELDLAIAGLERLLATTP